MKFVFVYILFFIMEQKRNCSGNIGNDYQFWFGLFCLRSVC